MVEVLIECTLSLHGPILCYTTLLYAADEYLCFICLGYVICGVFFR
jgi:hypothetical protein